MYSMVHFSCHLVNPFIKSWKLQRENIFPYSKEWIEGIATITLNSFLYRMPRCASADIISIQSERGSFSSRILNPNFSWVQYVSKMYQRGQRLHKMQEVFLYYNPFQFIHLGYDEIDCLFLLEYLSRIAEAWKCRWCKRSLSIQT